jgi:hypothetical protein
MRVDIGGTGFFGGGEDVRGERQGRLEGFEGVAVEGRLGSVA